MTPACLIAGCRSVQEDNYYRERVARDNLSSAASRSPLVARKIAGQLAVASAKTDAKSLMPVCARQVRTLSETKSSFSTPANLPPATTQHPSQRGQRSSPALMSGDPRLTVRRTETQDSYQRNVAPTVDGRLRGAVSARTKRGGFVR